jgi:hypothetical protein
MGKTAKRPRQNRTITVDFHEEAPYFQLLGNGKAFGELVMAFLLSMGFQLNHQATCRAGGALTRHLALRPCPPGWAYHRACPVYRVHSRIHRPAALRLVVPPSAVSRRWRSLASSVPWAARGW